MTQEGGPTAQALAQAPKVAPIAAQISAVVKAGLWGAQQGHIDWEGTHATKDTPSPRRLRVQRSGQEGATLTFLEFE